MNIYLELESWICIMSNLLIIYLLSIFEGKDLEGERFLKEKIPNAK